MLEENDDLETLKNTLIKKREENRAKLALFESVKQLKPLDSLIRQKEDLFRKIEEDRQREAQELQDETTSPKV